jgi:type I restriction enzyme R subunit
LGKTEPLRITFYKAVATFVRAYADIAQDMDKAGYTPDEATALKREVDLYGEMRSAIKKHSGEELDIKPFERDMRHLLNTYVQADPAVGLGNLDSLPLTELIIETGIHDAIARKLNAKGMTRNAIAETIINNVRKTIIREQLTDPRFYERMSKLLQDLIKQRRDDAASYELFLQNAEKLVRTIAKKGQVAGVPAILHGRPEAIVIYNNLEPILARMAGGVRDVDEEGRAGLALEIDRAMREEAQAGWKGDRAREAEVLNALYPIMGRDRDATRAVFEIIKQQPGYT